MTDSVEFKFLSGKIVLFPEKNIVDEDFHLSHVVSFFDDSKPILISEDEEASLSILYSIQFRKFIRYNFCSLELIKALAEKWVVQDWLIDQIDYKINQNEPDMIKKCLSCGVYFKQSENCLISCTFHPKPKNII